MKNLIKKQAELKERYLFEISIIWQNDKKMVDYCLKKNELYVPILNDTKIICLEKPQIEKEFYFPEHGYDFEQVCKHEREVNKDIRSFFIYENLKQINLYINLLKSNKIAAIQLYNNSCICEYCNIEFAGHKDKYILLDEQDKNNLLKGLEYQKKTFEKKLKSYLKKYGTKKISTSTYWADR